MSANRLSFAAACFVLFVMCVPRVMAGDNPYPRDWFWGNDEQRVTHDAMIGQPAPEIKLTDWINGEVTAESMKGKIVVVDIWATWCGPCIRSIPHNNEVMEHYAKDGVIVVGVCGSNSGQERLQEVAEEHGIKFPVGKDSTFEVAEAWNTMWWPTYAVVDRNNIVRAVGLKPSHVEEVIDSILEEQPYQETETADAEEATTESTTPQAAVINPAWLEGDEAKRARLEGLEGAAPPVLAVENWVNSDALSLKDLKGKVVLLDFWATWCGPCIRSIPHTNELQAKHAEDGLVIIGICNTRGGENMASSAEEHGIEYPIAVDIEGQTVGAYRVNGYPDYYFIDRSGNLRIADCRNSSVDDAVAALLAEPVEVQTAQAD